MADDATMTIKAVLLPDEIQATLKDLSFTYTPADANDKWFYGIVNVPHNTGGVDLITGKFLANSAGIAAGTANDDISVSDKIKFLFIKIQEQLMVYGTDESDAFRMVLCST